MASGASTESMSKSSAGSDLPDTYDVSEVARELPDLAISDEPTNEARLKELDVKYGIRLQIADQALKDRELRLKERSSKVEKWANPLTVGVIAGALGLLGTFVNGLWSNLNQAMELENQKTTEGIKLQNDLIKEAIKPSSEEERAKSLVFFAKNGLIKLDERVLNTLVEIAGTDQPVPGSSSLVPPVSPSSNELPIVYSPDIVSAIQANPVVPYPGDAVVKPKAPDHVIHAIILHTASAPDSAVDLLKNGRAGLPGPLAHWAVLSDGTIVFIAEETRKANHAGWAIDPLTNSTTIGIDATGLPAFADTRQIENLVRLVADVADRWEIPTSKILSHAEASPGRKTDMQQQAPAVREMVEAVRKQKTGYKTLLSMDGELQ